MLLRIFKTSQPLSWILIILLMVIMRSILFTFFFTPVYIPKNVSIADQFSFFLASNLPWLSHLLTLLIIIPSGFLFNKIAQDVNLFKGIHYLLFLFFGVFISFSPSNLILSPFIMSLPLILWSLGMILTQSKGQIQLASVFNASFLIGSALLIFAPNVLMFVILLISLFYLNQATWRSIVIAFLGITTPLLFHDILFFSLNIDESLFSTTFLSSIGAFSLAQYQPLKSIGVLLLLILIQIPTYYLSASKSIIKIRKALFLNLYFLILGILFTGFVYGNLGSLVNIILLPISILFTSIQLEIKKWWLTDFIFFVLLGSMALNYLQL